MACAQKFLHFSVRHCVTITLLSLRSCARAEMRLFWVVFKQCCESIIAYANRALLGYSPLPLKCECSRTPDTKTPNHWPRSWAPSCERWRPAFQQCLKTALKGLIFASEFSYVNFKKVNFANAFCAFENSFESLHIKRFTKILARVKNI